MIHRAKFCSNCGLKLDGDERFCAGCGAKVVEIQSGGSTVIGQKTEKDLFSDVIELRRSLEKTHELSPGQVRLYFELASDKHKKGEISRSAYHDLVDDLILRDKQGRTWTLGARTGKWYWKSSGQWVTGEPESPLVFQVVHSEPASAKSAVAAYCRRCGSSLSPAVKFCNKCGTARS